MTDKITDADLDRMERDALAIIDAANTAESACQVLGITPIKLGKTEADDDVESMAKDKLALIAALREARAEVERLNSDKYNLQQGIEDMEHSCCIRDGRPVVIQNAIEGNAVRLRYRCSHCMITWDVTKGRHGPDYFHDKEDTDG